MLQRKNLILEDNNNLFFSNHKKARENRNSASFPSINLSIYRLYLLFQTSDLSLSQENLLFTMHTFHLIAYYVMMLHYLRLSPS